MRIREYLLNEEKIPYIEKKDFIEYQNKVGLGACGTNSICFKRNGLWRDLYRKR